MYILGVQGEGHIFDGTRRIYHDSSAVLLNGQNVVAAAEEERFDRVKHSPFFPAHAIRFCLEQAGISLLEVNAIATGTTKSGWDELARLRMYDFAGHPRRDGVQLIDADFQREFGVSVADKLHFVHHHHAHAWSAYIPGGSDEALVVTLDGMGDMPSTSGSVSIGRNGKLEHKGLIGSEKSLGAYYTRMIQFLGYQQFDEYKVMGLAPYGDPSVFRDLVRKTYLLEPGGTYSFRGGDPIGHAPDLAEGKGFAPSRRRGEAFSQAHKDYAAALQEALEEIVLHVVSHLQKETGLKTLCLAGGVAHNCSVNGRIVSEGLFDRVFVQPAAHDAGLPLGACYAVLQEMQHKLSPIAYQSPYLGRDVPLAESIETELSTWSDYLDFELIPTEQTHKRAAQLMADGNVIGWVQGRSEFGPRALGNRSILADPRPAENKRVINSMVKKREGYRPFAPSVVEESVSEFFVTPESQTQYPFMTFILPVQEKWKSELGAITHVDGTARVQTVSKNQNARYWELLAAFGEITGIPMVLNTSFNNNAEPVVDSIYDAIVCYLTTDIDFLFLGDYLVKKRKKEAQWALLRPELSNSRLTMQIGSDGTKQYLVQAPLERFFYKTQASPIRQATFQVLSVADGRRTASEIAKELDLTDEIDSIALELKGLWDSRQLTLRP